MLRIYVDSEFLQLTSRVVPYSMARLKVLNQKLEYSTSLQTHLAAHGT